MIPRFRNIYIEMRDGFAEVVLNRADKLNALDMVSVEELERAVTWLNQRDDVRAVLMRGEGRAFCAGADLRELRGRLSSEEDLKRFIAQINNAFNAIEASSLPFICCVQGFALAGGLELLLSCDLAVVSKDARIGDQHVSFGLLPGGGSSQRLVKRIGAPKARYLLYTGQWLLGDEAATWGLAEKVVRTDELLETARSLAAEIAAKQKNIVASLKALVGVQHEAGLQDGIARESAAFLSAATKPAFSEGLERFLSGAD